MGGSSNGVAPKPFEPQSEQFRVDFERATNELVEVYDRFLMIMKPWAYPFYVSSMIQKSRLSRYLQNPVVAFLVRNFVDWNVVPFVVGIDGYRKSLKFRGSQIPLRLARRRIQNFLGLVTSALEDLGRTSPQDKPECASKIGDRLTRYIAELPRIRQTTSTEALTNLFLTALGVVIGAGTYEYYFASIFGAYFMSLSSFEQILALLVLLIITLIAVRLAVPPVFGFLYRLEIYIFALQDLQVKAKEERVETLLRSLMVEVAGKLFP